MFRFQKKACTKETMGTVVKKRYNGDTWFLTVSYTVEGVPYKRTEQLRYRPVKTYRAIGIPVGMRSSASLGHVQVGDAVRVCYNPQKHKRAYLPDNEGFLFT